MKSNLPNLGCVNQKTLNDNNFTFYSKHNIRKCIDLGRKSNNKFMAFDITNSVDNDYSLPCPEGWKEENDGTCFPPETYKNNDKECQSINFSIYGEEERENKKKEFETKCNVSFPKALSGNCFLGDKTILTEGECKYDYELFAIPESKIDCNKLENCFKESDKAYIQKILIDKQKSLQNLNNEISDYNIRLTAIEKDISYNQAKEDLERKNKIQQFSAKQKQLSRQILNIQSTLKAINDAENAQKTSLITAKELMKERDEKVERNMNELNMMDSKINTLSNNIKNQRKVFMEKNQIKHILNTSLTIIFVFFVIMIIYLFLIKGKNNNNNNFKFF